MSCPNVLCHVQLQTEVPLGDSGTDVTALLSPDLMPKFTSRPPPEMAACQTLVLAFVDALKKQELQVTSLKDAILSHKRHVNTLKQELSSACHREYGEEVSGGSCCVQLCHSTICLIKGALYGIEPSQRI